MHDPLHAGEGAFSEWDVEEFDDVGDFGDNIDVVSENAVSV